MRVRSALVKNAYSHDAEVQRGHAKDIQQNTQIIDDEQGAECDAVEDGVGEEQTAGGADAQLVDTGGHPDDNRQLAQREEKRRVAGGGVVNQSGEQGRD